MSYLEKIAEKVEVSNTHNLAARFEAEQTKIAALDEAREAMAMVAEATESEDFAKIAEILEVIVMEEAEDLDKTAEMLSEETEKVASAGPVTTALMEKRAAAQFESGLRDEVERIALLADIAGVTKEASDEYEIEELDKIAEVIAEVVDYDLEQLDGIMKEAAITPKALIEWLRATGSGAADFFKSLRHKEKWLDYGRQLKGVAKADQARGGLKAFRGAKAKGASNVVKGTKKKALKDMLAGGGKTGLMYGTPVAGLGLALRNKD
ncbi:MAG: hypothetical protein SVK08_01820 [Halobacteriota archaeon]|nr:hypothetical protein [Halobacteriota archaeon]